MTEHNPTSGNAPSLAKYLSDLQDKATRLHGVLEAAAFLVNEGGCKHGQAALTYLSEELANELSIALDTVNLPKGTLA